MEPVVHMIFSSGGYAVYDFSCECLECTRSKREYTAQFSVCLIRSGNFSYNIFRSSLDTYSGHALVNKPGYEYTVTHPAMLPDRCTVIRFNDPFYQSLLYEQVKDHRFFNDPDRQSTLVKIGPREEYLHRHLLHRIQRGYCTKLEADSIIMDILSQVLHAIEGKDTANLITDRQKKNHLRTIEQAKEYLSEYFTEDISLDRLAAHCYVSPFHFARIFRKFTGTSPHQYLLETRLKHAELLLQSGKPVADTAFQSGFNSIEHFSATFSNRFRISPKIFRKRYLIEQDS